MSSPTVKMVGQLLSINTSNHTFSVKDVPFAYVHSRSKAKAKVVDNSGEIISDHIDMTEQLNYYFSSVFTSSQMPSMNENSDEANSTILSDIRISSDQVMKKLDRLRSDKASGPDDLSPRVLKEVKEKICEPLGLTIILQRSIDEGVVPDDWRQANISPIYKKGCKAQTANYRPVSLTSQVSKLCESLIRDAVVEHLENNRLIRDSQNGFRSGRSCLSNLLEFLHKVIQANNYSWKSREARAPVPHSWRRHCHKFIRL